MPVIYVFMISFDVGFYIAMNQKRFTIFINNLIHHRSILQMANTKKRKDKGLGFPKRKCNVKV